MDSAGCTAPSPSVARTTTTGSVPGSNGSAPAAPGEPRERPLQLGVGPGRTVVERHLDARDPAVARERDPRHERPAAHLAVPVDPRHRAHDGRLHPPALLPVALVRLGDDLEVLEPLRLLHAEVPGREQPGRVAVRAREHAAVHPDRHDRDRPHRVGERQRVAVPADRAEDDLDRALAHARALEQRRERNAGPCGRRDQVAAHGVRDALERGVLLDLRERQQLVVRQLERRVHRPVDPQPPRGGVHDRIHDLLVHRVEVVDRRDQRRQPRHVEPRPRAHRPGGPAPPSRHRADDRGRRRGNRARPSSSHPAAKPSPPTTPARSMTRRDGSSGRAAGDREVGRSQPRVREPRRDPTRGGAPGQRAARTWSDPSLPTTGRTRPARRGRRAARAPGRPRRRRRVPRATAAAPPGRA